MKERILGVANRGRRSKSLRGSRKDIALIHCTDKFTNGSWLQLYCPTPTS